jgi:hypothetical protein
MAWSPGPSRTLWRRRWPPRRRRRPGRRLARPARTAPRSRLAAPGPRAIRCSPVAGRPTGAGPRRPRARAGRALASPRRRRRTAASRPELPAGEEPFEGEILQAHTARRRRPDVRRGIRIRTSELTASYFKRPGLTALTLEWRSLRASRPCSSCSTRATTGCCSKTSPAEWRRVAATIAVAVWPRN